MEKGEVVHIFIAPDKGLPIEEVQMVEAIADKGLFGDRYSTQQGSWSNSKMDVIRHVTLIEIEAINAANEEFGTNFTPKDTRRNMVTKGIDLNALVNSVFKVGPVRILGVELCDPCDRPSVLSGVKGFKEAFDSRGGVRGRVLNDGYIIIGDPVE
jgi:hypothetical protein